MGRLGGVPGRGASKGGRQKKKGAGTPPQSDPGAGRGESILFFSILSFFLGFQVSKKIKCPSTDFGCGPGAGPFFLFLTPEGSSPFFFGGDSQIT